MDLLALQFAFRDLWRTFVSLHPDPSPFGVLAHKGLEQAYEGMKAALEYKHCQNKRSQVRKSSSSPSCS